jgi:hypothetical protein
LFAAASPSSLASDWNLFYNGNQSQLQRGLLWTEIEWKRPDEIKLHSEWENVPQVYVDGCSVDDIQQGTLGDCYFLSCLSVLADHQGMIERLILTPQVTPSGVFAARFCKHGEWHDVLVDDKFPCVRRNDLDQDDVRSVSCTTFCQNHAMMLATALPIRQLPFCVACMWQHACITHTAEYCCYHAGDA